MVVLERVVVATPIPAVHRAGRLAYLDVLKVLLTVLVIAHHAGQAYGPTGGRWPIFEPQRAAVLGPFFSVNAAFFMGLFFLLSAYFVPSSFDRKGARAFIRDRALRLGVPLVVIGLTIGALTGTGFDAAHLWFAAHLLVYGLLYAGWRALRLPGVRMGVPSHRAILGYALLLAGVTALVRLWFPIDRWVTVLGVVPIEVAHLPQYASLFAIGLLATRGRWLERVETATGMVWLAVGVALSVLRYLFGADAFVWSAWEAFICVGLCVGLPVLARELRAAWPRWATDNAFGAYVVHVVPVVVGLQFGLASVHADPLLKFALVTVLGVPLSFLLAAGLRRLPGVRAVL